MMIRWKASWIAILLSAGIATAQQQQDVPTEADLAAITDDKPQFIDRLLSVIEKEIVPKTDSGSTGGDSTSGTAKSPSRERREASVRPKSGPIA